MVMVHKAYSVTGAVETDNEVTIVRLDAKQSIQPEHFRPGAEDR